MMRNTLTRRNFLPYVLALSSMCSWTGVTAQNPLADTLTRKWNRYMRDHLQEKLFLHTDRDYYLTGETLWFSAYLTDGSWHKPLSMSKVVYVELLDRNNQRVAEAKISIQDGYGSGSLFLSAALNSDRYQLRAYSGWMKNYNPEFYFHQEITLVNPFIKPDSLISTSSFAVEAHFFPEGGQLLAGVPGKVAFKVNDQSGRGIPFSGALVDAHNDTVLHFSPMKFGIGNFSFTPESGNSYRAVIRTARRSQLVNLPAVQAQGYSLHLEDAQNQLAVDVVRTGDNSPSDAVCLLVHTRHIILRAEVRFMEKNKTRFIIRKSDLPEGVSHFTVFTERMQPVCERLYFKSPLAKPLAQLSTDQPQYGVRAKVALNLQGNPSDFMSVAVVRQDSLSENSPVGILEYLMLTSDLAGTVESPHDYFGQDSLTRQAQDNLMLTHGWRRFVWDSVFNPRSANRFPPELNGPIVQGMVKDDQGKPVPGVMSYASMPGRIIKLYTSSSNQRGEVYFELNEVRGPQRLILQTNVKKDSLFHVEMTDPFSSRFASRRFGSFRIPPGLARPLLSRSVGMQVQSVYMKEENSRLASIPTDSISFYGKADEIYYLDDYTRFPVMEEIMREYVPGVMVRKRKDGFHFIVLNTLNHSVFRETPLILLDGVPLFDEDDIMNFDPLKVKKLEVVTHRYFRGPLVAPGIVSYTTYRGDLAGFQLNPKSLSINYDGLQLNQEFYSPRYEITNSFQNRLPDFRSLLYWNPAIRLDETGKKQIEFYTSDLPGQYRVAIEGISDQGQAGSASSYFDVKKTGN